MRLHSWLAGWFPKKSLGQRGEDAAARHLKRSGCKILVRSLDSRLGEIDIIALDGRTIVFVEVKTRASADAGHPTEAVDAAKQQRITQAALGYLKSHRLLEHTARFDVIAITWPANATAPTAIEHFKNAFPPVGAGQFFS